MCVLHFDLRLVPKNISSWVDKEPLCLDPGSLRSARSDGAARSPTVAAMAPPLMIQGWVRRWEEGEEGEEVETKTSLCGGRPRAKQPLCPSCVHLAVFQPIVAPGGSSAPPARPRRHLEPRRFPTPSASTPENVPGNICKLTPRLAAKWPPEEPFEEG